MKSYSYCTYNHITFSHIKKKHRIVSQDNFKKLLHLQTRLGEPDLVQANRELVREGEIQKISRSNIDTRYLVLCSDCLVYAKYSFGMHGGNVDPASAPLRTSYKVRDAVCFFFPLKHSLSPRERMHFIWREICFFFGGELK